MKSDYAKSEKIWRCDCGGSHFISITVPYDGMPILGIEYYEDCSSWLERLKLAVHALRKKRFVMDEILLDTKTAQEIRDQLNELLKSS